MRTFNVILIILSYGYNIQKLIIRTYFNLFFDAKVIKIQNCIRRMKSHLLYDRCKQWTPISIPSSWAIQLWYQSIHIIPWDPRGGGGGWRLLHRGCFSAPCCSLGTTLHPWVGCTGFVIHSSGVIPFVEGCS